MRWLLLLLLLPLAASAQEKSPTRATALSVVVPGGGQLYAGETTKGAAILGTAALGAAVAVSAWERAECTTFGCAPEFSTYYEFDGTRFALGAGLAGAAWLYGVIDAPGAARRTNRRQARITAIPTASGASVHVAIPL